jgi:hypothetical protein
VSVNYFNLLLTNCIHDNNNNCRSDWRWMSPVLASSPALTTFTLYLVAYAVLLALAASLYVIIVHTGNAAHSILVRLTAIH